MIPIQSQIEQVQFEKWMQQKGLSESSISKYARQAHKRILRDIGLSFYQMKNVEELSQLLTDVRMLEQQMINDPRRMYSSAVSNYIKFKSEKEDMENTNNDLTYERAVEKILQPSRKIPTWNDSPQPRASLVIGSMTRYERKAQVGANAIVLANFECQVNGNHRFFNSRKTHQNYVEAHHLIPIAYQGIFEHGIDIVENIVALCPACHRCIHYAEDRSRMELVDQLFKKITPNLNRVGIEIKRKELLELYQIV